MHNLLHSRANAFMHVGINYNLDTLGSLRYGKMQQSRPLSSFMVNNSSCEEENPRLQKRYQTQSSDSSARKRLTPSG